MRLIDADALRIAIDKLEAESDMPKMWHNGIAYAVNRIVHAPIVDPIKHGHWDEEMGGYVCSLCEGFSDFATNYCPYCGAKMDEVKDDNA